jgi:hypothetical protein
MGRGARAEPEPPVLRRLREHVGRGPRDLVAMDRDFEPTNAVLFELLNAMDGLDEDHDLLFVLTTNRADLLEPALAARPGRIDQAVELPHGVSPAFIRELLRRAALICAEDSDGDLHVTAEHLERALQELRLGANELTNTLLGAQPTSNPDE